MQRWLLGRDHVALATIPYRNRNHPLIGIFALTVAHLQAEDILDGHWAAPAATPASALLKTGARQSIWIWDDLGCRLAVPGAVNVVVLPSAVGRTVRPCSYAMTKRNAGRFAPATTFRLRLA